MRSLTSALATLSFVAVSAHAAVKTQFFYQAEPDANVAQAQLYYLDNTIKTNDVDSSQYKMMGFKGINFNYEHGFDDMFAVGIILPYQTTGTSRAATNDNDLTVSGLGDINIYGKGTYALDETMNLRFGLGLNYSLSKKKFTDSKEDFQDGRVAMIPYIGYDMNLGSFNVGAKMSYEIGITKAKWDYAQTKNDDSFDVKGADVFKLAIFGEMPMSWGLGGASLTYRSTSAHKQTDTSSGSAQEDVNDGTQWLDVDIYATYIVNDMITIVPSLGYSFLTSSNYMYSGVSGANEMRANVAGRFTF